MAMVFYIVGAIILVYWIRGMIQPAWNRPRIILEKGPAILGLGIVLLILGYIL